MKKPNQPQTPHAQTEFTVDQERLRKCITAALRILNDRNATKVLDKKNQSTLPSESQ